jgi:hypothetical protein
MQELTIPAKIGVMDDRDEPKRESVPPKTPGQKAAETKGRIERVREAKMAAWTRKNGKNDALNPYSKQNYPH